MRKPDGRDVQLTTLAPADPLSGMARWREGSLTTLVAMICVGLRALEEERACVPFTPPFLQPRSHLPTLAITSCEAIGPKCALLCN